MLVVEVRLFHPLGKVNMMPTDITDGILNVQIAETLAKGSGNIHGIDSSASMIASAQAAAASADEQASTACTFEVLDAANLSTSTLKPVSYNKIFSNAALHWILRPESVRASLFPALHALLEPGGVMVFEMGGLGNVPEMRAALLSIVSRRVGIEKAREVNSTSFPYLPLPTSSTYPENYC